MMIGVSDHNSNDIDSDYGEMWKFSFTQMQIEEARGLRAELESALSSGAPHHHHHSTDKSFPNTLALDIVSTNLSFSMIRSYLRGPRPSPRRP